MITKFISKVVRTITLSRVVLWSLLTLFGIAGFTIYENRGRVIAYIAAPARTAGPATFTVSEDTKQQVENLVVGEKVIIGVAVMSADLRFNEAKMVHFFGTDPGLKAVAETARRTKTDQLPIFTADEASNLEAIKLLNGQFSCVKFEKTPISRIYPELATSVKMLCRSSIPSYYGFFSGYVTAFVADIPSPDAQVKLKIQIEKLANDIYFKDVAGNRHPIPLTN